jgi:hypothetical protein
MTQHERAIVAHADAWEDDNAALRERLGRLERAARDAADTIEDYEASDDWLDDRAKELRAALASQPMQELGFLDQPPVSAIFDGSITERLSKTRQMLEKKLASQPEEDK